MCAQVLMDFPQLTMTLPDGREESIMKRTTLVGCVSFLTLRCWAPVVQCVSALLVPLGHLSTALM